MSFDDDEWNATLVEAETRTRPALYVASEREAPALVLAKARVDWVQLLGNGPRPHNWLAGDLFEQGQQVALVGPGTAGKSLLLLEWMHAVSKGLPFLGAPARPPAHVLMLDDENTERDLYDRAFAFGYLPEDFDNITYLSFPERPPLNTIEGGRWLMDAVLATGAQVVTLDTVLRMIDGNENDSQVWNALYSYALKPLKAAGVSVIRLDHTGNDPDSERARGSSAKRQDIDLNYMLRVKKSFKTGSALVELKRNRSRGARDETILIDRHAEYVDEGAGVEYWRGGGTRHVRHDDPRYRSEQAIYDGPGPDLTPEELAIADKMDETGLAPEIGRERARGWAATHHVPYNNAMFARVVKYRKDRGAKTLGTGLSSENAPVPNLYQNPGYRSDQPIHRKDESGSGLVQVGTGSTFPQVEPVPGTGLVQDPDPLTVSTGTGPPLEEGGLYQDGEGEPEEDGADLASWPSIPPPGSEDE